MWNPSPSYTRVYPLAVKRGRGALVTWGMLSAALCLVTGPVQADTVHVKGKPPLKGVVVEEQADRYVVSTIDGEVEILKALVETLTYDDPEQSQYQLGRQFQQAGRFREALRAYQRATEIRPDFHVAREALFDVQRRLWRQDESQVAEELRQKRFVLQRREHRAQTPMASLTAPTFDERFGGRVSYHADGWTVVEAVRVHSPADQAGLQVGDFILTVGGDSIVHLTAEAVAHHFAAAQGEFSLTIERTVTLQHPTQALSDNRWGLDMELRYDGWRVAKVMPESPADGHLLTGDLLVAIGEKPVRYLDRPNVEQLLVSSKILKISFQRFLILRAFRLPEE